MSRVLAFFTLMFAVSLAVSAATSTFDVVIAESCQMMAEQDPAEETKQEAEEEEPDCD